MECNQSKAILLLLVVVTGIVAVSAETCSHSSDCHNKCTIGQPMCFSGKCSCLDVSSNPVGIENVNPCYSDSDCLGVCTDPKLQRCEQCSAHTCSCHCN